MQASMRGTEELVLLLTRCAAGDRPALRELYRRTAPALFARVLRLVRDRGLAEEILQETYISVWRNAGRYDRHAGAPMTWLGSIARYRALDLIQRRRPALSLEESDVAETEVDPAATPLEAAVASAERRALMECLNELEGEARRSIELAFWRGLSYAEVAAVTRRPEGTVKSWIRRGLQRLKACLER
jgi:RNA polymerase sigma-70 factor (ECF subfamily)